MHKNIMLIALFISSALMGSQEKLAADKKEKANHALIADTQKNFDFNNKEDRGLMHALACKAERVIMCADKQFKYWYSEYGYVLYVCCVPGQETHILKFALNDTQGCYYQYKNEHRYNKNEHRRTSKKCTKHCATCKRVVWSTCYAALVTAGIVCLLRLAKLSQMEDENVIVNYHSV